MKNLRLNISGAVFLASSLSMCVFASDTMPMTQATTQDLISTIPPPVLDAYNDAIADILRNSNINSINSATIPKYPLETFTFGFGFAAKLPDMPIYANLNIGVSKAKLHSIGIEYRHDVGVNVGASFLYGNAKKTYNDASPSSSFKQTMYAGLVDIGYMIHIMQVASPHLSLSAGYGKHTLKNVDNNNDKSEFDNFIWGIKAGSAFYLMQDVKLDLSYRMLFAGFKNRKSKILHNATAALQINF